MSDPAPERPGRRWPHGVYGGGSEPDLRFSLANERTFLAGVRTALALLAGGVALEALDPPVEPHLRLASSLVLVLLGCAVPVWTWLAWARTERAMRRDETMPSVGPVVSLLAVGLVLCGVLLFVGLVVGR